MWLHVKLCPDDFYQFWKIVDHSLQNMASAPFLHSTPGDTSMCRLHLLIESLLERQSAMGPQHLDVLVEDIRLQGSLFPDIEHLL